MGADPARWMLVLMGLLFLAPGAWAHTQEEKAFYLQSRIVLRLNPRDLAAGNAVGAWHLEYQQLKEAQQGFSTVLRFHPGHFLAAMGLVLIAEIQGNPGAALTRANAMGKTPSGFAPFLALVRGRLLFKLGRLEEAERTLGGIETTAQPFGRNLWLGRVMEARNRPEAALAFYRKALAADPYWLEPYSRISLIHKRAGRDALAARVLSEVLYLDNPSPYPNDDIRTLWAWVLRPATR